MPIAQYITNILCGAFMFWMIALFVSVAAGVDFLGSVLLFSSIIIFGFVSGLSFFLPRCGATLSLILSLPFLYVGVTSDSTSGAWLITIPASIVTFVSIISLLRKTNSIWSRNRNPLTKAMLLAAAVIPAAYTTWFLVSFFKSVTFIKN